MAVYVKGLNETIKALEQLGVDAADLKDVFGPIGARAASVIQAATPTRSGRLRASVKPSRTKNKSVIRAGSTRVPYARPLNYGWPKRNIRPRGFMQAADRVLDENEVAQLVQDGLNELIRKHGLE